MKTNRWMDTQTDKQIDIGGSRVAFVIDIQIFGPRTFNTGIKRSDSACLV